jgi:hypothetical protein
MARGHRAIRHSHTQTHGTHRRLPRNSVAHTDVSLPVDCAAADNFSSFACIWPDTATNATQTVDSSFPGAFEAAGMHTTKNFDGDSVNDAALFSSGSWLADASHFSSVASDGKCVNSDNSSHDFTSNNDESGTRVLGMDLGVSGGSSATPVSGDLMRCHENELFHSTRDVSVQFDQLLDEWAASTSTTAVDTGSGPEHACPSSLSRLMLTSASQTVAIDFDAVSTQTMECDFDAVDFDFANTETQTTSDLLDAYFGFTDIETQTVQDLQLWDSQTQTCFDSLI